MRLFHGPDLETLLERLERRLMEPLDDPFAVEIVVVPSADIANHLKKRLGAVLGDGGRANGVVANIDFVYPREVINATFDEPAYNSGSPWDARRLAWTVAASIDDHGLADEVPGFTERPLRTARRIADLFDRYASHRPEMLATWSDDREYLHMRPDGGQAWQQRVFAAVMSDLSDAPDARRAIADEDAFATHVAALADAGRLPRRLTVFGADGLARSARRVLKTLAVQGGVDVEAHLVYLFGTATPVIPSGQSGPRPANHRLSSRWGRQMVETIAVACDDFSTAGATIKPVETGRHRGPSLLTRIQSGIVDDADVPSLAHDDESRDAILRRGDGSLQVHGCYGPTRQAEALRDALLSLFNDDPSLRLRDVLVLCGDVSASAPVLKAVLDPPSSEAVPRLPINVVRSRSTAINATTEAFVAVLGTVTSRCTADDVLEAVSLDRVASTFGLDADALARLATWADDLGVRFGIDAAHRRRWSIPDSIANGSWDLALDRLVAGLAVPAAAGNFAAVPYEDLSGGDYAGVGALAEFLARLRDIVARLYDDGGSPRSLDVATWCDVMRDVLDNFVTVPAREEESRLMLHRAIDAIEDESGAPGRAGFAVADLVAISGEYLDEGFSLYSRRTESITVAGLGEMRHIPFRVVAIFGADDAAFVGARPDGDDVLAVVPQPGEPIYSLTGRQNLLEAVMAARDTVILTCNGTNIANNKEIPFAVPVRELLDLAADTLGPEADGGTAVVFRHPRHNFDTDTLAPGRIVAGRAFTFDPVAASALRTVERRRAGVVARPVPGAAPSHLAHLGPLRSSDDLVTAVTNPIKYHLEHILDIRVPELAGGPSGSRHDADGVIQLSLDGLATWREGQQLLNAVLADGGDLRRAVSRWMMRRSRTGLLPPGALGTLTSDEIAAEVLALVAALPGDLRRSETISLNCPLWPPDGGGDTPSLRIGGLVTGRDAGPDALVRIKFKRFNEAELLGLWIDLALVTALRGGAAVEGHMVRRGTGNDDRTKSPVRVTMTLAGDDDTERAVNARRIIDTVAGLHRLASAGVVPFFPGVSPLLGRGKSRAGDSSLEAAYDADKKSDPAIGFVYDGVDWDDVAAIQASDLDRSTLGVADDDERSRTVLVATALWSCFDDTALCEGLPR